MNYSISTVQLSPFGEDQWNRMITYSPTYLHWTDLLMISPKRTQKSTSGKRSLVSSIDINSIGLDDETLLNEIYDIRKTTTMPPTNKTHSFNEAKFLDEDRDRRTTSPTDEYQRSSDFFYQTREPLKPHCSFESSFLNQQSYTKRSLLRPQVCIYVNYLNKIFLFRLTILDH
jgi:hypothetical protein